jgi:hypothetical protein
LNYAITKLNEPDGLDIEFAERPLNTADEYIVQENRCSTSLVADKSFFIVKDAIQFIFSIV